MNPDAMAMVSKNDKVVGAYTTLKAILGEGAAYWAGSTMLTVADDATAITDQGDITVRKAPAALWATWIWTATWILTT